MNPPNPHPHLPQHIAIVMDGNGRWAREQNLPRAEGHRAGKTTLRNIVSHCTQIGIKALSVFAFSSENWRRPKDEVNSLLSLFESTLLQESQDLAKNGVHLRIVGDLSRFPLGLRKLFDLVHTRQQVDTRMQLTVAVNYGGRWDIVEAAKKLAKSGKPFTEEAFAEHLVFAHLPDPDLFIRTGGEQRLSNFMLWQSAYSEVYFSKQLWPEFTAQHLDEAIAWYAGRERRFGALAAASADTAPTIAKPLPQVLEADQTLDSLKKTPTGTMLPKPAALPPDLPSPRP